MAYNNLDMENTHGNDNSNDNSIDNSIKFDTIHVDDGSVNNSENTHNGLEFDTMSMDEEDYKILKMVGMHGDDLSAVEGDARALVIDTYDYDKYGCITRVLAPREWFSSAEEFREKLRTDFRDQLQNELDGIISDCARTMCELINVMGIECFMNYMKYEDIICEDPDLERYKSPVKIELLRSFYTYLYFISIESTIAGENGKIVAEKNAEIREWFVESIKDVLDTADEIDDANKLIEALADKVSERASGSVKLDIERAVTDRIIDIMAIEEGAMGIASDLMEEESIIDAYSGVIKYNVPEAINRDNFSNEHYIYIITALYKSYLEGALGE